MQGYSESQVNSPLLPTTTNWLDSSEDEDDADLRVVEENDDDDDDDEEEDDSPSDDSEVDETFASVFGSKQAKEMHEKELTSVLSAAKATAAEFQSYRPGETEIKHQSQFDELHNLLYNTHAAPEMMDDLIPDDGDLPDDLSADELDDEELQFNLRQKLYHAVAETAQNIDWATGEHGTGIPPQPKGMSPEDVRDVLQNKEARHTLGACQDTVYKMFMQTSSPSQFVIDSFRHLVDIRIGKELVGTKVAYRSATSRSGNGVYRSVLIEAVHAQHSENRFLNRRSNHPMEEGGVGGEQEKDKDAAGEDGGEEDEEDTNDEEVQRFTWKYCMDHNITYRVNIQVTVRVTTVEIPASIVQQCKDPVVAMAFAMEMQRRKEEGGIGSLSHHVTTTTHVGMTLMTMPVPFGFNDDPTLPPVPAELQGAFQIGNRRMWWHHQRRSTPNRVMTVWDMTNKQLPRAAAYVQSRSESARSTANTRVVVTSKCMRAARKDATKLGLIDIEVVLAQPRLAVISLFQLFIVMRVRTVEEMMEFVFPPFRPGAMGTEDEATPRAFRKTYEPAAEEFVYSAVEAMLYRQQAAAPLPHTTYNVVTNIPDIRKELEDIREKNKDMYPALQKHALQQKYSESLRFMLSQLLAHNSHGISFGGADLYPRLMQLGIMVRQAALLHFGLRQPDDIDAGPHQYYLDPSTLIMQIIKFLFRRHHHRWLSQLRKGKTDPQWLRWYLAFTLFNRMRSGNMAPNTSARHLLGVTQADRGQPIPLAGHDALRLEVGIRHRQTQQSEACEIVPMRTPDGGKLRVDVSIQFSRMADRSITTRDLQRLVGMYISGTPLVRRKQDDLPPGVIGAEELEKRQMQEDEDMAAAALRGEELPEKPRTPNVSPYEFVAQDAPLIIVDGAVVGRLVHPKTVRGAVDILRVARRSGNLPWDAAVYFSPTTTAVCVWRVPGTVYWPIILTHRLADFIYLVTSGCLPPVPELAINVLQVQGIIEWVCAAEAQWGHRRIAPTFVQLAEWKDDEVPYDAVCLHQLQPFFTGVVSHGAAIEAVRLTFSLKQLRQASGFSIAMHQYATHEPTSVERNLTTTVTTDNFEEQGMWVGVYALVAFVCRLETTEDAIILNKQAKERGLGQHVQYAHSRYLLKMNSKQMKNVSIMTVPLDQEEFAHVPRLRANYDLLGPDGIIKKGSSVAFGAVLVRRIKRETTMVNGETVVTFTDDSAVFHYQLVWTVDSVEIDEKVNAVKFRFTRLHSWSSGDKITTMHASKGVFVERDSWDLPQCVSKGPYLGVTPNLIINPLTLLKRGLVGPAFEACSNELAIAVGETVAGTSMQPMDWEAMQTEMRKRGIEPVQMIDGATGVPFQTPIFMAHLRVMTMVKHRPASSTHARGAHGLTTSMGQAVRGRARDGGVRQSEMTSTLLTAAGVAHTPCHLVKSSDGRTVPVCVKCGRLGMNPPRTVADAVKTSIKMAPEESEVRANDVEFVDSLTQRSKKCLNAACGGNIVMVIIPQSMLVASQKLQGLNIVMRFMPKPDDMLVQQMRNLVLHGKKDRSSLPTVAESVDEEIIA